MLHQSAAEIAPNSPHWALDSEALEPGQCDPCIAPGWSLCANPGNLLPARLAETPNLPSGHPHDVHGAVTGTLTGKAKTPSSNTLFLGNCEGCGSSEGDGSGEGITSLHGNLNLLEISPLASSEVPGEASRGGEFSISSIRDALEAYRQSERVQTPSAHNAAGRPNSIVMITMDI